MNDFQEDPYPCIGYCQLDDAGYCLGCGRPTQVVAASGASNNGGMCGEMPAVDCQSAGNRFPVDPLTNEKNRAEA